MEKPHRRWRRRASWPLTSARANGRDEAVLLWWEAGMDSFVIFFFMCGRGETRPHTFGCGGGHTLVAFHSAPCGTCRPFVFMLMTQTLWFVCIWMWWFAEVFEVVAD